MSHVTHPKETQNYRSKWLQACGSNICGHEVIWKTGAGPPEGHHWTLAGSSSVWQQRSVDDAVNMGLHYVLQHLDRPLAYARILFVDFSSAFNTIIPNILLPKLTQLSVSTSICHWINSFLTDRQQLLRAVFSPHCSSLSTWTYTSSTRTISTGAPQGCVLSPLLFSLYMNIHIQHPYNQHWSSSGLYSLPTALISVHWPTSIYTVSITDGSKCSSQILNRN